MSRSALDRLLRRRCRSRLLLLPKPDSEHKPFKVYEPGYVHVYVKYLPQLQDEDKRWYVFLTDNGKEFADRLFGRRGAGPRESTSSISCAIAWVSSLLTKPKTPQTNGMVKRFNGRLSQVLRT